MAETMTGIGARQQWIGGEWVPSASGETAEVRNPATGEVIATVPASGTEDVDRAASAAAAAFEQLAAQHAPGPQPPPAPPRRCRRSRAPTSSVASRAATAASPSAPPSTRSGAMVDNLRFFAGAARVMEGKAANEYLAGHTSLIRRDPVGVVASIAPWNYPLYMAGWKIGPALAAGNTVILKPSIRTPLTALALAEIAADILPPGVLNVITGTGEAIGDALVLHPAVAMVSVTGDTETGKRIARNAADSIKRLHLELGGKAPVIVFDDADLESAVENIRLWGYWNAGQDCTAATRVITGPAIHDRFVARLAEQVGTLRWGDPAESDDLDMGSLIAPTHVDKVAGMVERASQDAEVVVGGTRPDRAGAYYEPTVIVGPDAGQRDRPGRGLRPGRHGAALQRRG